MTIIIGTSGWSYDDWVGPFYPSELAKEKGKWFSYYAGYFNTVEINSTFYRPPGEQQVQSWIKKAPSGFEYSAKMPQLVTHKALVDGNLENAVFWAETFERICVKPLAGAGVLGSVLIQLSPYFKRSDQGMRDLLGLMDMLPTHEHNYAIEFRHRSWLDESRREIDAVALEALQERNVANVLLDGPGQPITGAQTADHAYIRFHGHNPDIWFGKEKEEGDHRLNRYDYLYEKKQLDQWVPRIKEAEIKAAKVRVYFNNHARAKAIKNAFQLMDMLLGEHKHKEIKLQDQFTLREF